MLAKGAASMVKKMPVPVKRQAELRDDLRKNVPGHVRRSRREYRRWLRRPQPHAERLCQAAAPTWIVHAETGDGGLTGDERRMLEACHQVHLVTIPGAAFLLPVETPEQIAEVIIEALPNATARTYVARLAPAPPRASGADGERRRQIGGPGIPADEDCAVDQPRSR
jgi:pimeloyl-ACP methyl ester carboxylesterase